ncbi:hypothetical protein CTAYLR_008538 [Chrysophaeum taylorii]|uniref:Uncharacterized protein n=1 Tax=Chrysophaeum taylorii TaxID=2483200 RepID=A0AAD7XJV3_9STRA|nr:hypothetical protein CTAYLR_008538 [Chrysophaeum taylorii]
MAVGSEAAAANKSVVFVKTYKTGSTTVAEFLSSVGAREGLHSLHPEQNGAFAEGELARRAKRGERYDLVYRHPTPRLDEASLATLVPNALWVTIIREPVSRFLSTLDFVQRVSRRYGGSPRRVVDAARRGILPAADANTFCNNFAWVLSGRGSAEESLAFARRSSPVYSRLLAHLDANYLVLVQDDMLTSLSLVARAMRWDVHGLNVGEARRSRKKRVAPGAAAAAPATATGECGPDCEAILTCNQLDQPLYAHFKKKFDSRARDPALDPIKRAFLAATPATRESLLRHYPINCQIPGSFPKTKEFINKHSKKVKEVAEKREFCVVALWFATVLPWFHTFGVWVVPVGLVLLLIAKLVPPLQFLATGVGFALALLGLMGPGDVFKSLIGLLELGPKMIPMLIFLVVYGLSVILFSFKPMLKIIDVIKYQYLAAGAGVAAIAALALLLSDGPKRPGSGLVVGIFASAWAFKRSRDDFDPGSPGGGYSGVSS